MKIINTKNTYLFIKYKMHKFPRLLEYIEYIHSILRDRRRKNISRLEIERIKNEPKITEFTLELTNRCNGTCAFCPVNKNVETRKFMRMKTELFYKIIEDLKEIQYNGVLSMFGNNEPLLDSRILEFIKYAKEQLPKAKIQMLTNGKLLNIDNFKEFADNLDIFVIDNYYHGKLNLNKNIKKIYDIYKNKYDNVKISMRKDDEIMSSRGGTAKNRSVFPKLISSCTAPWTHMYVTPSGEAKLCCSNPLDEGEPIGDLNKNTIKEIFYGKKYKEIRNKMISGRQNVLYCQMCDVIADI